MVDKKPKDWPAARTGWTLVFLFGTMAYLMNIILQVLFIPAVSMAPNFCVDHVEFESGPDEWSGICVKFSNPIEEAKYYHNQRMRDRNEKLLTAELGLWWCVIILIFRIKRRCVPLAEDLVVTLFMAFVVVFVVPLMLSWILPPPVDWFPSIIREINDSRVEAAMQDILRSQ